MNSRTVLMVLGVVTVVMGLMALIPDTGYWANATEPMWHAIVKIVVGAFAIYVGATDKPAV